MSSDTDFVCSPLISCREGHSALAENDGWLYVGFRTTSQVVRFRLDRNGDLLRPVVGELIAQFDPFDDERGSADLMDIAFNSAGEMFVVTARSGRVWRVGVPAPEKVFDGREGTRHKPHIDLAVHTGNPRARCGNLAFDDSGNLYVCGSTYGSGTAPEGAVYRVPAARQGHANRGEGETGGFR